MTKPFLLRLRDLVSKGNWRISDHGFRELRDDGIALTDILSGLASAQIVEEYPEYAKGPCILLLQHDSGGAPIHALWGTSKANPEEAVLITAYRPDPDRWSSDFLRRLPR